MKLSTLIALGVSLTFLFDARAQRREGGDDLASLEIELKSAARFGDTRIPRGRYRLSFANEKLVLYQARTMVEAAQLDVEEKALPRVAPRAKAHVSKKRSKVEIRVRYRDREYVARGSVAEEKTPAGPTVDLASRKGAFGVTGGIPDAKSELELVAGALARYEKDVKHCADQAQKNRWTTDHPRFRRCVCPLTGKWRLPKVEKAIRVHRMLAKKRSGYSITVTDAGKVADCRVWIGPKPPSDEKTTAQASPSPGREP
ncbi:MAG: hypothetical protein AAF658_00600 [Myxococcota bacterium]